MARQSGLNRDLDRLMVADLSDHDDVRVLAHDTAQAVGEGQTDRRLHLDLIDAVQLVFDRVFDGDDLLFDTVDLVERGVERRRLTGACRAGDQHDAVRLGDQAAELLELGALHPEFRQAPHGGLFVENTHDGALAVDGRNRGDAQVDLTARTADAHTAVLRQPPLRDVQIGQNFDAAQNGRVVPSGRGRLLVQHAVDPVPDTDFALEGFDMDVRSAVLNGLIDDQVDHLDDELFFRHLLQVVDIEAVFIDDSVLRLFDTLDHPGHIRLFAQAPDLAGRGEDRRNIEARQQTQIVDRVNIERVGHRDHELIVVAAQRNHRIGRMAHRELLRNDVQHLRVGRLRREIDDRTVQLAGERLQEIGLGDKPHAEQDLTDAFAFIALALLGKSGIQLF